MIRVEKVVVPVADQDRAKEFWTAKLGYEVVTDTPYGDERWLEVRPRGGGVHLVLELKSGVTAEGAPSSELPNSNVMFDCEDIVATHRELAAKGVNFPQPPVRQPFGWWAMVSDSEGNRFALGQRDD